MPQDWLEVVPDFVVEIRSKHDRRRDILHKVGEYLAAGVTAVLNFDPTSLTLEIHRDDETQTFRGDDAWSLPDLLPGFSATVRELAEQEEELLQPSDEETKLGSRMGNTCGIWPGPDTGWLFARPDRLARIAAGYGNLQPLGRGKAAFGPRHSSHFRRCSAVSNSNATTSDLSCRTSKVNGFAGGSGAAAESLGAAAGGGHQAATRRFISFVKATLSAAGMPTKSAVGWSNRTEGKPRNCMRSCCNRRVFLRRTLP